MPVIVFASSKGGAGKTTAATVLAGELARRSAPAGIGVTPDRRRSEPAQRKMGVTGLPEQSRSYPKTQTKRALLIDIEQAEENSGYVLVDLEGTASATVANAILRADYVIALCQGSQDDADEAVKTIKLIRNQSKLLKRVIPFSVLFTRTSPAIQPRTLRHIVEQFEGAGS